MSDVETTSDDGDGDDQGLIDKVKDTGVGVEDPNIVGAGEPLLEEAAEGEDLGEV